VGDFLNSWATIKF